MTRISGLPLFPLGVVLYPGERLPLYIFEPRYKAMVQYCLERDVPFGVVLFNEDRMERVGCTARIERVVKRYDDGRMEIVVAGEQRFRVLRLDQEAPYLRAEVELLDEPDVDADVALRERAITQHMKLLELAGRTMRPSLYQDVPHVSYVLAQNAGLPLEQKQALLEMPGENERIAFLIAHFEALIPRVEQMEELRRRIQSNGHFKDFPPE
ncbi:MAG: ATP-dependent protease [Bacteroidetes bacterium]|nr:ATP-dependent protease [Rhodothermaceae bacterium RA]RMH66337.1 MAG: ATP-dependent protease [Bacteroidota bacterium]